MKWNHPRCHSISISMLCRQSKKGAGTTLKTVKSPPVFIRFMHRFKAEIKKVKNLRSKPLSFDRSAEIKTPLPISTIWGRGIVFDLQQSPYPFALKNRGFERRTPKHGGAA